MKKLIAILAALTLGCTMLAACGEEDSSSKADSSSNVSAADSSEADSSDVDSSSKADSSDVDSSSEADSSDVDSSEPDQPSGEGRLNALMDEIDSSGSFTIDMTVEQEGMTMSVYVTTDGSSTYMDMDMMGMKISALDKDGVSYILDNAGKRYYKDETGETTASTEGMVDELVGAEFTLTGTSKVTIEGVEYDCESYKSVNVDGEENTVDYVFNADGKVAFIGQQEEYMPVTLLAGADTSKLSIDGYTEMTDEEYMAWYSELLGVEG